MSEMPPEGPPPEGGGNVLTRKYMGVPGIVWLGGAAILAYFLFFRGKGSSGGAPAPTETGGTINLVVPTGDKNQGFNTTEGSTAFNPSNNGINPGQPQVSGAINPQPTPVVPGMTATQITNTPTAAKPPKTTYTYYTVQKGDTLASVAKKFGIAVAALAAANVYVPGEVKGNKKVGQPLGTGAGLLTGQVLKIPHTTLRA
jgi:LysM repeat protein